MIFKTRFGEYNHFQLILIVLLFVSFFYIIFGSSNKNIVGNSILGKSTDKNNEGEEINTSTPSPTVSPTVTPTSTPVPIFPSPTIQQAAPTTSSNQTDSSLIYPNARVVLQTSSEIRLESPDNPDTITPWYKEKIVAMGMNAKSFVTTKTNGNVLNKLVGANGNGEVRVEIERKEGELSTHIFVSTTLQTL